MRLSRRSLVCLVLPLLAVGAAVAAQQTTPQFKVAVDYVHVDATVTDAGGAFVRDLTAGDFEVYEDGKLQQVASFALVEAPGPGPGGAPRLRQRVAEPEPDVATNDMGNAGRVYVLLLDDLHVDPLRSGRVKEAARRFVEQHFGPNDIAAVLHTSGRADASQDFTNRRSLLLASIDKFIGRKLRSRVLEALDNFQQQRAQERSSADIRLEKATDPRDVERADQAQRTLQTLEGVADLLSKAAGRRKTVLFISEGIDYPFQEGVTQTATGLTAFTSTYAPAVLKRFQEAVGAAARANVNIYSVDPRGNATTGAETIEVGSFPENPALGLTPQAFEQDLRDAQTTLQMLSEQTGGIAAINTNDFGAVFDRVVRDSGTYYMLGYQSNNRRTDGTFRRIEVKVGRPGVRVRSRAGYRAASGKRAPELLTAAVEPSAVLRDALNAPLPIADMPLRMFAMPFRGAKDESIAVGIEIEARNFRFGQKDGLFTDRLEVALIALDEQAKFRGGDRQSVQLTLKPETYKSVQSRGLRVFFRLNLPPGRYQLRAAATETGAGVTGTAFHDVQVPEFHKAALAISGLAIASPRTAGMPTVRVDPIFQTSMPSAPTGARTFYPEETLTVLFEVYRAGTASAGTVDLTTSVHDADGGMRFKSDAQVQLEGLAGGGAGFGYTAQVPLEAMSPGKYTLRVEVRPRAGREEPVVREVPFAVSAPASPPKVP